MGLSVLPEAPFLCVPNGFVISVLGGHVSLVFDQLPDTDNAAITEFFRTASHG